jgi:excinuclease ABC subunit C
VTAIEQAGENAAAPDGGGELPSFREQARALPDEPGVYVFHDDDGPLYVGKARSLRKRVLSYLKRDAFDRKTRDLVPRVRRIEAVVAASETEALLLEQNFIKRYRPPFNVRLRDDKSYPYIAVTIEDEYPRVLFTRERHRKGVLYFGPYSSASKVRGTLETLNKIFPYRPCEGPTPGRRSGVPCLDYHIGRCAAPCVGLISAERYREVIDDVVEFLGGRTKRIERDLERRMREAAAAQEFEEAARLRNRLTAVRHLAQRQHVEAGSGSYDVIALAVEGGLANVQLFPVRSGRLDERRSLYLENADGAAPGEMIASFIGEFYAQQVAVPPLVVVPEPIEDAELLEAFLAERRGARVELRAAERGEKRRMLELAQRNAELALRHDALVAERTRARRASALEELREALDLEALPVRIECFDVSNLGESNRVASMVVFEEAVARRSDYRKFAIRESAGQDDFASIAEAVRRRFARHRLVEEDGYDRSFATLPNLVLIDGGKGQLSAAVAAMGEFDLPRVAVASIAKREEEVFVPGRAEPVRLPRDSVGNLLLQRVRDEAHRFALGFHRQRRARDQTDSMLDRLPGIGPKRRRALIEHFGDVERLLGASREELEAVPGLPSKVGRDLHAHLHRTGGAAPQ